MDKISDRCRLRPGRETVEVVGEQLAAMLLERPPASAAGAAAGGSGSRTIVTGEGSAHHLHTLASAWCPSELHPAMLA